MPGWPERRTSSYDHSLLDSQVKQLGDVPVSDESHSQVGVPRHVFVITAYFTDHNNNQFQHATRLLPSIWGGVISYRCAMSDLQKKGQNSEGAKRAVTQWGISIIIETIPNGMKARSFLIENGSVKTACSCSENHVHSVIPE